MLRHPLALHFASFIGSQREYETKDLAPNYCGELYYPQVAWKVVYKPVVPDLKKSNFMFIVVDIELEN